MTPEDYQPAVSAICHDLRLMAAQARDQEPKLAGESVLDESPQADPSAGDR
jgi:hypothetical protein